jgi:ABC-type microcin C transport system permease subunit YejB
MGAYIVRRILLMLPTLLGILFVSFVVVGSIPRSSRAWKSSTASINRRRSVSH